jgi:hypothetical protein
LVTCTLIKEAGVVGKPAASGLAGEEDVRERVLSEFEKKLVMRFEGGETQAQELPEGQFSFLKKTAAEWGNFFEKFLTRTFQKVVGWEDVKGILFRGLVQEKGMPQKGVLISDVMTHAGTDKFARLSVETARALQLAAGGPGTVIPKETLQSMMGGDLRYLALGPASGDDGAAARFTQAASRGMFTSQQLENRIAEQLGLVTDFRGVDPRVLGGQASGDARSGDARRRRARSMWARMFGGEEPGGDGSVFVPWWRWDREERGGARRWFVVVFGAVVFMLLIGLIVAMLHALR